MKQRLGLLAYATDTGLGVQTRALYRHLKPAKTMLVDLNQYNRHPVHDDWYRYDVRTHGIPADAEIDTFLDDLDAVLVCESPHNYRLFTAARERGIRTVLQYNYEFLDYMRADEINRPTVAKPDVLAAPTTWHLDDVEHMLRVTGSHAVMARLPVPIDIEALPRREITQARHFFHVAGRPTAHDRNGTLDYIAAVRMAAPQMPEATFSLYCQAPTEASREASPNDARVADEIFQAAEGTPITFVGHVENITDLYRQGDVMVLPRRYGGLCLPAQEAVGCGIPVLMTDVSPNNAWLPHGWLIPAVSPPKISMMFCQVEVHSASVAALAARMVDLYQHDDKARLMHREAREIASTMSWESLLPLYGEVLFGDLGDVCKVG